MLNTMARPSNEELMEERRAIAEILGTAEGETNAEAARRLSDLLQTVNSGSLELSRRIAELEAAAVAAVDLHPGRFSIGGPSGNPTKEWGVTDDNDPADPRPAMDPILGWRTPAVEAWVARRNLKTA